MPFVYTRLPSVAQPVCRPPMLPGRASVRLSGGGLSTGAPENPLTDAQVEEKFRVLTGDVLPKARVERLLNLLWNLDQVTHVGEVLALARPRRRSIRQ